MKIAVFSDTHRSIDGAIGAIRRHNPNLIIHLGDHYQDAQKIHMEFPYIPMECVPGNCDYVPDEKAVKQLNIMGVTIIITHGHHQRVKETLNGLWNLAYYAEADIVLFGHTHTPMYEYVTPTADAKEIGALPYHLVNPGSARGQHPTWAMIELEEGAVKNIRLMDIYE